MPDKRTHRGPHPADEKLFAPAAIADLRAALADFCLLLTKGYADKSALKLVGDRFSLTERQRLAVMRSACSDQQLASRSARRVEVTNLAGQLIAIDGYNVLITVEAALSGGVIFKGRDGCYRDLASIHGTYRKVTETIPAVQLIGEFLTEIRNQAGTGPDERGAEDSPHPSPLRPRPSAPPSIASALWLLDSPVSNSGRLKTLIRELAEKNRWDWEIKLSISPDAELKRTDAVVATSDSVVLDDCKTWLNLAAEIITQKLHSAAVIDLAPSSFSTRRNN